MEDHLILIEVVKEKVNFSDLNNRERQIYEIGLSNGAKIAKKNNYWAGFTVGGIVAIFISSLLYGINFL